MEKHIKIELCSTNECTGCMACVNSCANGSVVMIEDAEGFMYPQINHDTCVKCNKCVKNCSVLNPTTRQNGEPLGVYAAWANDLKVRRRGSSGGMFTAIACDIIAQGGIVFGAAFDENDCTLKHKGVETLDALRDLQGSKYVQSSIGNTYSEVKQNLKDGRSVLFVGTPCQVDGLYAFLNKVVYKGSLLTCDFVCHGVPSPGWLKKYVLKLQPQYKEPITALSFRDMKRQGLTINVKSGGKFLPVPLNQNYFFYAFLEGLLTRENCYNCKYTCLKRVGDITLADFWGLGNKIPFNHNKDYGVSLILSNTAVGNDVLNKISSSITIVERDIKEALVENHQLYMSSPRPEQRNTFFTDFDKLDNNELIVKYGLKLKNDKSILKSFIVQVLLELGIKDKIARMLKS